MSSHSTALKRNSSVMKEDGDKGTNHGQFNTKKRHHDVFTWYLRTLSTFNSRIYLEAPLIPTCDSQRQPIHMYVSERDIPVILYIFTGDGPFNSMCLPKEVALLSMRTNWKQLFHTPMPDKDSPFTCMYLVRDIHSTHFY